MAATSIQPSPSPRGLCDTREIEASIPDDFRLASGDRLSARVVRGRLKGPETAPLVVVAGGVSAGRTAADTSETPGWWNWAVRDGGPIDTRAVRVLAIDWLPDVGTTAVPTITTRDQARLLALVLDALVEPVIDAFVGASYGGCVGLAFAEAFPNRLRRLAVISAPHRAHPQATAWRGIQRRLLQLGLDTGREAEAIDLARQLAMTTYRSPEEFEQRFGDRPLPEAAGGVHAVCDYLTARGAAYRSATSARRWISLSDSLDRHRVDPVRIACPLTVVGFDSDQLVPAADLRALARSAPHLERLLIAPSLYGHDAFLKDRAVVGSALETFLSPVFASPIQDTKDLAA